MPFLRVLPLIPIIALAGCAHPRDLTFRVVDVSTGRPIQDVRCSREIVYWRLTPPIFFPARFTAFDYLNTIMTDSEGIVHLNNARSDQRLQFTKDGYSGEVVVDRTWPSIKMRYIPDGGTLGQEDEGALLVEVVDGAIVVPL